MNHYDWTHGTQKCQECGWSGLGAETDVGDTFESIADFYCLKCDHRFGFITYPLISGVKTDPRADPVDRIAQTLFEENARRAPELELKSVAQLPDIEPGPTKLVRDVIYGGVNP